MSEIPKAYEPHAVEDKWYDFWLKQNCFVANPNSIKPAYSIVIPPPNVTGMLHMGHVLNNTIQDILARKARMDGKEVLWLPGTDHAGIATEGMVAKQISKEEKKSKRDLGREEFLKRVWTWKEKHGGIIIEQLKKLGCSCDWTRERFTMDADYVRNVQRVFVDLYQKGLIYRGKRMVNWCPATQTALSDEEVEMRPQKGFMYHFRVQVVEEPDTWLTIATTRPETIPADTAVAVNPKDPRYTHLIGKHAYRALPIDQPKEQRRIPIIADEHVDFEFGTGVLKVTPAHDQADFDIGLRHKLPVIDVLTADGKMTAEAGVELAGLDRFAARKKAAEILEAAGTLAKAEPYENNVGFSQRAGVPIEPRLSEQWFLKYPAVAESKACVADGRMKFYPDRWTKVYDHWLTNIQDWCISRQLWWGHRIPVWRKPIETLGLGSCYVELSDLLSLPGDLRFVGKDSTEVAITIDGKKVSTDAKKLLAEGIELQKSEKSGERPIELVVCTLDSQLIARMEAQGWEQDPDVLDTWFSSWLWPFATMGWPQKTDTLKKFYPTTDLVTGPDIIFFWVARMIMAGYEYMRELPFHNVYFTGIIRDKQGRKMSKTLGNSPDPLILISQYGADALRFGTMRSAPLGQDVLFDEKDVELGRNFCNKLWNACRFRQMQGGEVQGEIDRQLLTSDDKWILLKLNRAIQEITTAFAEYRFNEATQTLYRFFWSEYCDWYVEASKAILNPSARGPEFPGQTPEQNAALSAKRRANTLAVIDFVLSHTLRLFHPFLPFISEELWHGMGYHSDMPDNQGGRTIMFAPWPKLFDEDFLGHYGLDDCYLEAVDAKYELVTQGRNLRREGNIPSSKKVKFIFKPVNQVIPHDAEVIKLLLNAESLKIDPNIEPPKGTPSVHSSLGALFLPLDGLVDVEAEKQRLTKEREKITAEITKVEQKLNNHNFASKAPPQVLTEHRQRLADWHAKLERVNQALAALQG